MKDTHFLYSIATLALGSILAIFVSLATGTLPTSTPREVSAALATTLPKKDCGCCTEMTPQEWAAFHQRNKRLREQRAAYQKTSELLKQYGLEEGLRRIKLSNPEIAEQLEHFINKHSVAAAH